MLCIPVTAVHVLFKAEGSVYEVSVATSKIQINHSKIESCLKEGKGTKNCSKR